MKRMFIGLLLSGFVLFFCSKLPPNSPVDRSDPGSANISISIGKVGSLGKIRNIELSKLYITLSAPGETTIRDSFSLSGNAGGTYARTYSNLASLLKTWTLTAESKDIDGNLIHYGDTSFIVPARSTIPVTLTLGAKYSMLKANFFPIRDSVTRCELLVNGNKQDDSSFAKQTLLGDTVKLSYNYLDTGAAQRIKLDVYGTMWGFDTLLYTGDTLVTPLSGANASYTVTLRWVGPGPLIGGASMTVVLGAVGTVTVNGELENVGTVTDIDGNVYHTVTIGTQTWMVENLKTTKYNDGTTIPLVTDNDTWANLTTPGYCWFNNDNTNKSTYGALYNWYAVNTGKLAPTGWHVPTDAEWTTLTTYLGGESVAGGKLKEAGLVHWLSPNTGANNESGFSALPGGFRSSNGAFSIQSYYGYWWSATEGDASHAYSRYLYCDSDYLDRYSSSKSCGFSVRLVRD